MMYTEQDIRLLVNKLNAYRHEYYNESQSEISDKEYDALFDKLAELEEATGIIFSDSPTQSVGYTVVSDLPEVTHEYPPMLSLDKTKEIQKTFEVFGKRAALVMAKLDGLTCRLTYEDGTLIRAETRGNGVTGEDITHNILAIANVPLSIPVPNRVLVDGEVLVPRDVFARLREKFVDNRGKKFKNARNFAAGSVRLYDSQRAAERGLEFFAWKLASGVEFDTFTEGLSELHNFGFTVVPHIKIEPDATVDDFTTYVDVLQNTCREKCIPIDGCVFSFNDTDYLETFDYTAHHWNAQLAFKFEDELYDTIIRDVDWTMGKTGVLTPTAIFDTVEIDGTDVSRASLHNLTIMRQLGVTQNCSAQVFKANMIIPQVKSVQDDGTNPFEIPTVCPFCGAPTVRVQENESEMLMCMSPMCSAKLLGFLSAYVSKECMNIDGLSEGKLQDLLDRGYIRNVLDIYSLYRYEESLKRLPGWGESSVTQLLSAIEKSRTVEPAHFIAALSIPNIGNASAKTMLKHFNDDIDQLVAALDSRVYDWSCIDGFGSKTAQTIQTWYDNNDAIFKQLFDLMTFVAPVKKQVYIHGAKIAGKTFCITGTFEYPRSSITKEIEAAGGIFVNSVTKKTDVLFVGDKAGGKLKKAQELGITIVEGDDYYEWIRGELNA